MPVITAEVRQWIGENHKTLGIALGGIFITVKFVVPAVQEKLADYRMKKTLKKWENASKDKVIFHTLPRGKTIPNLSPFAMKLETYLRIAKIPYEVDFETPMGLLGKTPWITFNGEHVMDSQLIINFLNKKCNVQIGNYSEEQRALGEAVRIVMDEYLYWGIVLWRWVQSEGKGLDKLFDLPPFMLKIFYKMVNKTITKYAYCQGMGRHSKEQIIEMTKETLKTASLLLGNKQFLLGDEPCEEDCAFFGFLGMVLWATPGSPYEVYINELPNLLAYCDRMKTRFWSDWESCLAGQ